jgi:hypothetical protein
MSSQRRLGLALFSLALGALSIHCSVVTDLDGLQGSGGAAAGATASGTATGASSSAEGGGGSDGECAAPEDCPGWENPCRERTCDRGVCGFHLVANGTPIDSQAEGDCKEVTCDGKGGEVTIFVVADPYDDGNGCTTDACENGVPTHAAAGVGSTCDDGSGGKLCTSTGHCVECLTGADCPEICSNSVCVPATCADSMQDGQESDVDCGGTDCTPCKDGQTCFSDSDCDSLVCDGKCATPTCADGVENGAETGADCGGPSCPKCKDGQGCALPADCTSGVCLLQICQVPTCSDGVKNALESDVDCGGGLPCKPCDLGKKCKVNTDCGAELCTAGLCIDPCTDKVKDKAETDVDCGGGFCPKCALGQSCNVATDCQSNKCCPAPKGCSIGLCPSQK